VTISLKIEIVKIFKLEFELSSDNIMKKKEKQNEKDPAPAGDPSKQPSKS
jgi:hypothetical protein